MKIGIRYRESWCLVTIPNGPACSKNDYFFFFEFLKSSMDELEDTLSNVIHYTPNGDKINNIEVSGPFFPLYNRAIYLKIYEIVS